MTIILISPMIFSISILAEAYETEVSSGEEYIKNNNLDEDYSLKQILYSLEIVELTEKNLSRVNMQRLAYTESRLDSEFNLIKREELTEIYGEEFELILNLHSEKYRSDIIFRPQIVVTAFHQGVLRVTEEELLLDVESVDSIVYTNVFELKVEPRQAYDNKNNAVLTLLSLKTGEGPTGLETEVWIEKDKAYLLGIMERYQEKIEKNNIGRAEETRKRYFALYLSARSAGILTLPDLSSSLYGLNRLIDEECIDQKESSINLHLAYLNNSSEYGLTLDGFIKSSNNFALTIDIDEALVKRHALGLMGRSYKSLWFGAEIIALDGNDYNAALSLMDTVEFNIFKLTAGVNPIVYNFEDRSDSITWFFRGETQLSKNLNMGLEYKALEENDFGEYSLSYSLTENYGLETGYTWNIDHKEEESFWLGLKLEF
jgi:hypothetical protein